ncbi:hypothetical protein B0H13DRAFT_2482905 [Mycena leptocephala]|nr:hypothetical protein B0H13DRAFT_2482905 [Mycena leptocephala]
MCFCRLPNSSIVWDESRFFESCVVQIGNASIDQRGREPEGQDELVGDGTKANQMKAILYFLYQTVDHSSLLPPPPSSPVQATSVHQTRTILMAQLSIQVADRRLPPELERVVFETAAMSAGLTFIPNLMLVASRVKDWIEPLLYRVVIICSGRVPRGFPVLTYDILLRSSVRSLFLDHNANPSSVEAILSACSHVTNLFVQLPSTPHLQYLGALQHLRRLTVDVDAIMRHPVVNVQHLATAFPSLTHLHLLGRGGRPANVEGLGVFLASIPNLMHLAFNRSWNIYSSAWKAHPQLDARLQYITCVVHKDSDGFEIDNLVTADNRFVRIYQRIDFPADWLRGAEMRMDHWALAEAIVARRMGS